MALSDEAQSSQALPEVMIQQAVFPSELVQLIAEVKLTTKPSWSLSYATDYPRDTDAEGNVVGRGFTFFVHIDEPDGYGRTQHRRVRHLFPVPPATYDRETWRRWLLNRLIDVQIHEMCEGFEDNGEHPFAPNHGPGRDPYTIFHYATDEQRRTQYTGEVKP